MNLSDELALSRSQVQPPTDAELIEAARDMIKHPDTSKALKPMLAALINEIDRLKARCRGLSKLRTV